MNLDLNIILSILVAFQLVFIAIFLLTNSKSPKNSNVFLGLFFLILAINVVDILLQINGIWSFLPLFFLLDDSFLLLYGPLIYLYVRSYLLKDFTFSKKSWRHFIPFIFCLFGMLFLYNSIELPYDNSYEAVSSGSVPKGVLIFIIAFYLHGLAYLWLAKKMLIEYERTSKQQYSNSDMINVSWLHFMINSFIIIWLLGIVQSIVPMTIFKTHVYLTLSVFILFLFYFINKVVFKALKTPRLLTGISPLKADKYSGSTLTGDKRDSILKKLKSLMEAERLYLNPDLNINDLADALEVRPKELSQTINQSYDQHFFDFVNSYRIEEAKKMLSDSDNSMTIQEIMYAVGFSSKSSFNTIFKRKTDKTPSQYRQSSVSG